MSAAEPIVFVVDDDVSFGGIPETAYRIGRLAIGVIRVRAGVPSRPRASVPSCVVLDVGLPDINGLDVQQRLADRSDMPIIFITGHTDVAITVRAMKAGAAEFLIKPFRNDVLLEAIGHAVERSRAALDQEAEMQALRARYASLSGRERAVMALVAAGRLNKLVGGELGISEITVKAHRGKMMRKMNAHSLPELVHMATKLGVLTQVLAKAA